MCVHSSYVCVLCAGFLVVKTQLLSMVPGLGLSCISVFLLHIIVVGTFLLNQAHGWFLEITFSAGMYVCVCTPLPQATNLTH